MAPERWHRIEELCQAARERGGEALAGIDPELRAEVEKLLRQESGGNALGRAVVPEPTLTLVSAGAQLGPYRIDARLGAGGMGEVFRATDTRLGRAVAIKVARDRFTDRFEREARAIAALNHPHICTLYDVGPDYLVMELVEGETLVARLKRGKLSIEQTVQYGAQIADALAAAHAKGIVHRDLKPGNVMITKSGVKVLDFGLAKSPGDQTLTASKMVLGTPAYMAPEQREGDECDARSDIYALGLTLKEMAPRTVPRALAHVLDRCIQPDPAERWQAASDVKRELEWSAVPEPGVARNDRRNPLVWGAAVALTVAALLAAWSLWPRGAGETRTYHLRIAPPPGSEFFRAPNRGGIALSPDGRMLAFTAVRDGKMRLWVEPLDSNTARELPGTDGAHLPFWDTSSRHIAFFAAEKLKRIDADGGNLQTLCDAPGPEGGTWNAAGRILFAVRRNPLYQIPETGGTPTHLTALDATRNELEHQGPGFLPDGNRFVYWISSTSPELTGMYGGSLDDPKRRVRIMGGNSWAFPAHAQSSQYLAWLRGDSVVAQRFDPTSFKLTGSEVPLANPSGLFGNTPEISAGGDILAYGPPLEAEADWVDRGGKTLATSGGPLGLANDPQISPDGRRYALGGSGWVVITDIARNVSARLAEGAGPFAWSPDGSEIAFSSRRNGGQRIAIRAVDGTGTEIQPAPSRPAQSVIAWLTDKSLAYYEINEESRELWIIPPGVRPRRIRASGKGDARAQLSADGRWLAYSSEESGRLELYVERLNLEPGAREQRWQVSNSGGRFPRWRHDGTELFYVAMDGELMSVAIKQEGESLSLGQPRALFPLPTLYASVYSYDVTADGQRFLIIAPSSRRGHEPLSVIVNWPALLKRK